LHGSITRHAALFLFLGYAILRLAVSQEKHDECGFGVAVVLIALHSWWKRARVLTNGIGAFLLGLVVLYLLVRLAGYDEHVITEQCRTI
jgi:RsiW-degrading membrane proteinase PrsW (M82 family)